MHYLNVLNFLAGSPLMPLSLISSRHNAGVSKHAKRLQRWHGALWIRLAVLFLLPQAALATHAPPSASPMTAWFKGSPTNDWNDGASWEAPAPDHHFRFAP